MAELLSPLTALGDAEPFTAQIGDYHLRELTDRAYAGFASRRGREAEARAALQSWLGNPPPGPGRMVGAERCAIWLAPEQWLVAAPLAVAVASDLRRAAGSAASITELTDAWCPFVLSGTQTHHVLARLCPLDAENLVNGDAQRTLLHHLNCLVLCESPEEITILGPRSSAGSLKHALVTVLEALA